MLKPTDIHLDKIVILNTSCEDKQIQITKVPNSIIVIFNENEKKNI